MTGRTLSEAIADRETIWAHCKRFGCQRSRKLDLVALSDRLGPNHGAMAADLVPLLRCTSCGSREVMITVQPDYEPKDLPPVRG